MWKDEYLKWDAKQFSGIDKVFIPPNRIWTPDICLYNA